MAIIKEVQTSKTKIKCSAKDGVKETDIFSGGVAIMKNGIDFTQKSIADLHMIVLLHI